MAQCRLHGIHRVARRKPTDMHAMNDVSIVKTLPAVVVRCPAESLHSIQSSHHFVFAKRMKVVQVNALGGEEAFGVGRDEFAVELGCNGKFYASC